MRLVHAVNSTSTSKSSEIGKQGQLDILVLSDTTFNYINTVKDQLDALKQFSRHRVVTMDYRYFNRPRASAALTFDRFDVVIVHYSVVVSNRGRLSLFFRESLLKFQGLKVVFIQDEYRWIDATAKGIASCGFHIIFSVVNEEIVDQIYHHPELAGVRKEITLTGFVPTHLLGHAVPAYIDRKIDVGYRARRVPTWLGSFAHEKWLIGQRFREAGHTFRLKCDIESDEDKRIYGKAWIDFVSNCKAMLGTESGASICDFDGTLQSRVESYEAQHPNASFDSVRNALFADTDGVLTIQVISPRSFEAAALRTLMILYPGKYSGRLTPWRHYVPLERDLSNLAEVIAILRDPERAEAIIECAYQEVACNKANSFEGFVEHVDRVIDEEFPLRTYQRSVLRPDFTYIRNFAGKYDRLMSVRHKLVNALHGVGHFIIGRFVPNHLQPKFIKAAQSVWRSVFGIG